MSESMDFTPDGPEGLRLLADWFDATRPEEPDKVQQDLRGWANDMEVAIDYLRQYRDQGPPGRVGRAFVDNLLERYPERV